MKNDLQGMALPTCELLVNGQLRKLYGKNKNKVYLHNGDNFQLKFFNPLRERIGVQLCMNGIKVDNDLLVINPGQEITIERYIGTNRKLTFSSYDIDTSTMSESRVKEAKKAIEKNGVLEVVFWNEKQIKQDLYYTNHTPYWVTSPAQTITYSGSTTTANLTVSSNDVVINGNLKINGTLDINNGQLVVTNATIRSTGTSGSSGASGKSGTSGTSGISGTSGTRGWSGTGGTSGMPDFSGMQTSTGYIAPGDISLQYFNTANSGGGGGLSMDGNIGLGTTNPTGQLYYIDYAPDRMYRGAAGPLGPQGHQGQPGRQLSKKIETGRIERGGVSNQYFSPIAFEVGEPFYRVKFKLLPFSMKPVKKKLYDSNTIKSILDGGNTTNTYIRSESAVREYCKCGYRISRGKGAWNNCPMCGRKIKK